MKLKTKKTRKTFAPTQISIGKNYIQKGDVYERCFTVVEAPPSFYSGAMARLIGNPDIRVECRCDVSRVDIASLINGDIRTMSQTYYHTSNQEEKEALRQKMENLRVTVANLVRRRDKNFNFLMNIWVTATSLTELDDTCDTVRTQLASMDYSVSVLNYVQEKLWKRTSVWFVNDNFNSDMSYNLGTLYPSLSLAGSFPWIYDTLEDNNGLLLGEEYSNGGVVLFDQFLYLNDTETAVRDGRLNGNMVVVGESGAGKTTAVNMLMMTHMFNKRKVVWIDPENRIRNLIESVNGSYFNLGTDSARINIFDLKPISCDEDENIDMYDTKIAIYNVVEDLRIVFKYLYPNISDDTLAVIGEIVVDTYKEVGITFDTDFRYLKPHQYPTFTKFSNRVDERIERLESFGGEQYKDDLKVLKDLSIKLKPILNEWSRYFDGQTTINLNESANPFIGFGTKVFFNVSDGLCNAVLHIIFQFAWGMCLDESEESAFCIDEAHMMILKGDTARMVEQFMRRSRKYRNATIIATQEPHDFSDEKFLSQGKAIFNNATYKVILRLNADGVRDLKKLMNLTDGETALIPNFTQGDALLCCGKKTIPLRILPTKDMLRLMK